MQKLITVFLGAFILNSSFVFAQTIPSAQQASGQESLRQMQEKDKKLRERLNEQPKAQSIEDQVTAPEAPAAQPSTAEFQKVLIKKVNVTGNTILASREIEKIIAPFEGKELSLREMQKVSDLLTDAYRKRGFITTRAILPPQQMTSNVLEIKVIQGLMGDLEVKGNRYFKKKLFTKRVSLKKGQLFNYNELRNNLNTINQYPDRNVKTVITPGKEQGETDVVFNVKDRLPIHVSFFYDNFGSRYIGKNRYLGTVTDYNLLGFDDVFTFQYQAGEMNASRVTSFRYQVPVFKNTEIGFYATQSQMELQEEFKVLEARGKSKLYGIFVNQTLINGQDLKVTASAGLDYKDVFNYQLGVESSRDRLRVPKFGFNVDYADALNGRNIFNNEIDFGVPNIMGGLRDVDSRSSRVGSGGEFVKDVVDYLRLQRLPWDASLFIKTQTQFASTILPAAEQYQLGGITNVRGFAPGEASGDSGNSFTAELGLPLYLLPRSMPVPFSKAKLYDSFRLTVFYDSGYVRSRNPQAGEPKKKNLDSLGWGMRLNLPQNFFIRLDFAWPVTGKPSDSHNQHIWFQVSKEF